MNRQQLILVSLVIICLFLRVPAGSAQQTPPSETSPPPAQTECAENLNVIVKNNTEPHFPAWDGEIFALASGKRVKKASADHACHAIPPGNYIILLTVRDALPELKEKHPFTFSVKEGSQTTFTLEIGASREPEMQKGIIRTVKGEDYLNFALPLADPALCKTRCEKDPNCGSYTYCYYHRAQEARCYLIRGAGTPGDAGQQDCVSGVIQKNSAPYQAHITFQPVPAK